VLVPDMTCLDVLVDLEDIISISLDLKALRDSMYMSLLTRA